MTASLAERTRERIRADGPMPFSAFMEAALYDPDGGFYAAGGRAGGRAGDFLTAPEVGPLFGTVLAGAIDAWWDELGRPDPFTVVDAGAGPGTLARAVLSANPACRAAGALRYVAVERSAGQRAAHEGLPVESVPNLPGEPFTGVVLANELLDNLPFRLAVFDGGWREAAVDVGADHRFVEVLGGPLTDPPGSLPATAAHGARVPIQDEAVRWVQHAVELVRSGRVVALDYAGTTAAMAERPWREWLRTYRSHQRGGHYLDAPGSQDITAEVALDELPAPTTVRSQAAFLEAHGIGALVEAGRTYWHEHAARPDLAAFKARSRVREAEALLAPAGLGAFTVAEWVVATQP